MLACAPRINVGSMQTRRRSVLMVVSVAMFCWLVAGAYGNASQVRGRVFTLAEFPFTGSVPGSFALAADGTVWVGDSRGVLWQLRPGALQPVVAGPYLADSSAGYAGLAAAQDGSLLVTEFNRVWRRSPGGAMTLVAGSLSDGVDTSSLSRADGGQAVGTMICKASGVAALPDGGFVFIDSGGLAVRRVAADGMISTLYAVTQADRAYGCSAAGSDTIASVAVAPDGAALLAVDHGTKYTRILRLTPTGAAKVLARLPGSSGAIAAAPDGSVLIVNGPGVLLRLAVGAGRAQTVLPGPSSGDSEALRLSDFFGHDGALARDFYTPNGISNVAVAADGGIITLADRTPADGDTTPIVYVAPAAPTRLAVALLAREGRATNAGYAVPYRVTRPGRARVAFVNSRGRVVATVSQHARTGLNTIRLRRRFRFGTYDVRLTITGADGQQVLSAIRRFMGGRLPLSYARKLLVPRHVDIGGDCDTCEQDWRAVRDEGCRRLAATRIDCGYSYQSGDQKTDRTCLYASARLGSGGVITLRSGEVLDCPNKQPVTRWLPIADFEIGGLQLLPTQR